MTIYGDLQRALARLISATGLDYSLYGELLQRFTNQAHSLPARQLHARLILHSITPNNFLGSKLITHYSKTNRISYARHVFDQIPHRNAFSYNAMLIAYTLHDRHVDALNLFSVLSRSSASKPDNHSLTCLLKSLSSLTICEVRLASMVHGFVVVNGFDSDVFVSNGLISCYSSCVNLVLAREVFDEMRHRDVVSWNSMIAGYSQRGFYSECKMLFKEMVDFSEFNPDKVSVVSVLQACGHSKDFAFGNEVHRYAVENGIELDIFANNALVAFYAKCGRLDYARELFDGMRERDSVSYGAIISGYMFHGFVDKGMDLFRTMENPGLSIWNAVISGLVQNSRHEGVLDLVREMQSVGYKLNPVTLSSVLPSLSNLSNLRGGKEIHGYAVRNSYDKSAYVSTAIIDTYGKLGYLHGARRVFDQSKSRSLVIWTAIISAYAANGDANSVLSLFDDMLNEGIQPDPVTFIVVLSACAHCGFVDKAWGVFNSMSSKHGIEPLIEHYACMVGVLSRAGRLQKALEFVNEMPLRPSAKVWGTLLDGASVAGDVELGRFVSERLFEIEPKNTGNYVIMANLYSQAGRWKEANEIRKRMDAVGLKKIAGSSWIESVEGTHNHNKRDSSSEGNDEAYQMSMNCLA